MLIYTSSMPYLLTMATVTRFVYSLLTIRYHVVSASFRSSPRWAESTSAIPSFSISIGTA